MSTGLCKVVEDAAADAELRSRFYQLLESLSALRSLTEITLQHDSEHALLEQALEQLLASGVFIDCAVHLVEDGALRFATGRVAGGRASSLQSAARDALIAECAQSCTTLHWHDCATEARNRGLPPGDGSLMGTPLIARGELLGVLSVGDPQPGGLEPWHAHSLELFCNVFAALVENGRLLTEMERSVHNRTQQLEVALREAEELKQRYEQLCNIDELTSLYNRRFFFPQARALLARALRHGQAFSLLLGDIDLFKQINDRHGHAMGDRVLRDVAGELRGLLREGDIVARFGGEEFVIALPSTKASGARLLASRILTSIAKLRWHDADGDEIGTSISFGATSLGERAVAQAGINDHGPLLDELLREADDALYAAKANGRNRLHVYGESPAAGGAGSTSVNQRPR